MMVDAREFDPPPKVQSAVVRLQRTDKYEKDILDQKVFKQVVKQAFNQRRKKLSNALSGIDFDETKLPKGIFDLRAEQLSVLDFILLSNLVQK
jgi:16S rRNA (adenine1518-N6/adenine1519-N6)-dimethyltransferase